MLPHLLTPRVFITHEIKSPPLLAGRPVVRKRTAPKQIRALPLQFHPEAGDHALNRDFLL
jgi:hypothetical protein